MLITLNIIYIDVYLIKQKLKAMKNLFKQATRLSSIALVAFSMILFTGCERETETLDSTTANFNANKPGDMSIGEIAEGNPNFTVLLAAIDYVDDELDAGLRDLFTNGTDQYTVFAPTNDAFVDLLGVLGASELGDLDPELVLDVLKYHVVEGRRASNSVVPKNRPRKIETLLEVSFYVNSDLSIDAVGNTSNIIAEPEPLFDISASNGIIHAIDAVLLPIEL